MKPKFVNKYTQLQRQIIDRLAEIEKEDEDACANCGGEDCICCEIYLDRQKWQDPDQLLDQLFAEIDDLYYGWHDDDSQTANEDH
jgi:hypothetical protein